jgi:hypothetical protein
MFDSTSCNEPTALESLGVLFCCYGVSSADTNRPSQQSEELVVRVVHDSFCHDRIRDAGEGSFKIPSQRSSPASRSPSLPFWRIVVVVTKPTYPLPLQYSSQYNRKEQKEKKKKRKKQSPPFSRRPRLNGRIEIRALVWVVSK